MDVSVWYRSVLLIQVYRNRKATQERQTEKILKRFNRSCGVCTLLRSTKSHVTWGQYYGKGDKYWFHHLKANHVESWRFSMMKFRSTCVGIFHQWSFHRNWWTNVVSIITAIQTPWSDEWETRSLRSPLVGNICSPFRPSGESLLKAKRRKESGKDQTYTRTIQRYLIADDTSRSEMPQSV